MWKESFDNTPIPLDQQMQRIIKPLKKVFTYLRAALPLNMALLEKQFFKTFKVDFR